VLPAALFGGATVVLLMGSLLARAGLRVAEGGLKSGVHRTTWEQAFLRLPRAAVYPVAVLAELLARLGGPAPLVTRDELRMAAKHMYFSSAKAERELGFSARPAAEAVADALAWFRAHALID